ncbi:MAG: hypothetical protein WD512_06655, partial [Candidatus Paceibacterota bacterium]
MNYHIYHQAYQFEFTFNFVNTVGDLQTVILQALNISKDDLLFILHNDKILGKDYLFTQDLSQAELFDIDLFVVTDYYRVSQGTKATYNQWLLSQITNTDLIVANQQLLFYNTHNNLSTPNLNFFTNNNTTSTSNINSSPDSTTPSHTSSNNNGSAATRRPANTRPTNRPIFSRPTNSGSAGFSGARPTNSGSAGFSGARHANSG